MKDELVIKIIPVLMLIVGIIAMILRKEDKKTEQIKYIFCDVRTGN